MTENATRIGPGTIYTEPELVALIDRGEGQFLEFKSAWDRSRGQRRPLPRRALRDKIAEVVAAFANADGGVLLVGVDDDGTPTGHGYPDAVVDGLLAVPRTRLDDLVSCRRARGRIGTHEILIFETLISPEAIMVEGNGFPYRVGEHIVRQPQETINAKKQAYQKVGYEQRYSPDATLDALDGEVLRRFIDRTPLQRRPIADALTHYGLAEHGAREWRLTNAALLLFGRRTGFPWHPRAGIRMFRVAGTARRHGRDRNVTQLATIWPPVVAALDDALQIGHTQVRRAERLNGMRFEDDPEIPDFAWREAITNAIAHRDYEIQSRETEVWFYEDRMEVTSPGGVAPPATEAMLRERVPAHASRNPMLVRALAAAGYMRDEGEGILRIHEEMAAKALPPPQISVEHGIFTIRLFNGSRDGAVAEPELTWPSLPSRSAPTGDES